MKNMVKVSGFIFILFYLAGCAGTASGPSYKVAKAKQIKPGYSILYVFREYAEPTLWGATIHIDGKEVQSLSQGGFTWVYAKPGKRNITAVWSGMASQRDANIAVKLGCCRTETDKILQISEASLTDLLNSCLLFSESYQYPV